MTEAMESALACDGLMADPRFTVLLQKMHLT
jgi:hypothetical protein